MSSQDLIYRFGPYELRTRTHEVYKNGKKLRLRPQPFQVLRALVERSGDVVTRGALQRLLWPAETFGDFEHGLNMAIKELRGVLSDSASKPRYIETLPKLGYRIVVPVESAFVQPAKESPLRTEAASAENSVAINQSPHSPGRWSKGRWAPLAAITVVLSVGLGAYVQWSRSRARLGLHAERVMLAVLPFENLTGDATQDYFSDGLTEEMIAQLGRLDPQRLGVIARTSVMHYKQSQDSLPEIGHELGVQYVLEGSVRRESNRVRISAQLIQMKDQTHLWSRQYDRELSGLLALQGEIAGEAANEIQLALGGDGRRIAAARKPATAPSSYEAYDLYLKGRYFWNKRSREGFQLAAESFQTAVAKDPNYARAYAGLADTFALMSNWGNVPPNEFMPKARAAAAKALQIDETLAEAHTSLALIAENYDYDWQTAEKEFRRAIDLDPSYATAHQWYAECLSLQGRFAEALAESERARQLDPLSLIIATDHGAILYYSRRYDRAIEQSRAVLEMEPGFPRVGGFILSSYVQEARFAEALAETEQTKPLPDEPWTWASRAYVYGRWGRAAQAQQALAKFEQLIRYSQSRWTPELLKAYVGMGRNEEAIALLQKAYTEHSNLLVVLKVDPIYDPLRSDPRFQDLLRRVHLAE